MVRSHWLSRNCIPHDMVFRSRPWFTVPSFNRQGVLPEVCLVYSLNRQQGRTSHSYPGDSYRRCDYCTVSSGTYLHWILHCLRRRRFIIHFRIVRIILHTMLFASMATYQWTDQRLLIRQWRGRPYRSIPSNWLSSRRHAG